MRKALFLLLLLSPALALAALKFPALTGRVVDDAHVISPPGKASLEQMLADHESKTSNQIVVVTLSSLQGTSIEDYGYQLGRIWGIGQKGKDNGVLLIVAPREHKVRIEVGYGLEPILTDAMSSQIVQGIILPNFRAGHMEQGILAGTRAIISTLDSDEGGTAPIQAQQTQQKINPISAIAFLILFLPFWLILHFGALLLPVGRPNRFGSSRLMGTGWAVGGFGGGGFGGGFGGGGGGFGGGGAGGSW